MRTSFLNKWCWWGCLKMIETERRESALIWTTSSLVTSSKTIHTSSRTSLTWSTKNVISLIRMRKKLIWSLRRLNKWCSSLNQLKDQETLPIEIRRQGLSSHLRWTLVLILGRERIACIILKFQNNFSTVIVTDHCWRNHLLWI